MIQHETTSNVTVGDDVLIKQIKYNPALLTPNTDSPMEFDDEISFDSQYPMKIYSYEWTIISSALVYAYQTYHHHDDNPTWNPDESDYIRAEKQFQVVPGTMARTVVRWNKDGNDYESGLSETQARWATRTINFQAKRWKSGEKKGQWKIPPISLNASKLDTMSFRVYVRNTNSSEVADFYSLLKIKSWKQEL